MVYSHYNKLFFKCELALDEFMIQRSDMDGNNDFLA